LHQETGVGLQTPANPLVRIPPVAGRPAPGGAMNFIVNGQADLIFAGYLRAPSGPLPR